MIHTEHIGRVSISSVTTPPKPLATVKSSAVAADEEEMKRVPMTNETTSLMVDEEGYILPAVYTY